MLPFLAPDNLTDCRLSNSVLFRQLSLTEITSRILLANSSHLFCRELRLRMFFAPHLSFLCRSITHIVVEGAEKQMGRIATGRIITGMTNVKPFRDFTFFKPVHQSGCSALHTVNRDQAIAFSPGSRPRPARIRTAPVNFSIQSPTQSFAVIRIKRSLVSAK